MSSKKIISLLLCLMLVLSISACTETPSTTVDNHTDNDESAENTDDTKVIEDGITDGTFTGTGKGHNGYIEVSVEIKAGKISNIEILKHSETAGISDIAFLEVPKAIIDAQVTEVDTVSGATYSSKGIMEAVSTALRTNADVANLPKLEMKAGIYTGEAKGYAGTIKVEVYVSNDSILDVKVLDNIPFENPLIPDVGWLTGFLTATTKELEPIFETAKNLLPQRIVEQQSLRVDTISGATASSNGILSAVENCIVQAGGNPEALAVAVEKKNITEEYTCDVVVIGGGTAGATAAAKASEMGANVILIEKSGRVGGTGVLSYMPMTTGSRIHDKAGIKIDTKDLHDDIMAQTHYYTNGKILSKFLQESSDTINFLDDNGFDFVLPPTTGVGDNSGNMAMAFYKASPMSNEVQAFFDSLVKNVDKVMYETTGKSLIQDANGKVIGVEAEKYDGIKVIIHADNVIVATGGFGGNSEMVKKYNDGRNIRPFGLSQNTGEGLNMMLAAGAAEMNIGGFCAHETDVFANIQGDEFDIIDKSIPYTLSITPTFMQVNQKGERFTDENERADLLQSSANRYIGNGGVWYTLISKEQVEILKSQGLQGVGMDRPPIHAGFLLQPLPIDMKMENLDAVLEAGKKVGTVFEGSTLEELAKVINVDVEELKENVLRYNEICEEGYDDDFYKDSNYLKPLPDKGPYYALKSVALSYSTQGGVDVNSNMQVLDTNGRVIEGLYAVGVESMGVITDGVAYPDVEGLALGWGFNSGKIAGAHAAQK